MHYVLFYDVVDDFVNRRSAYRNEHLKCVQDAYQRGDLVLAGALADPVDGALLIFKGPDPSAAEKFAKADAYVRTGLVTSWRIRKWSTVVGEGSTAPSVPDATGHSE